LCRIDQTLIAGGRYSIVEKADGREIDHGEYTAIDPPHRLAFWLEVPVHFEGGTDIVVSFLTTWEGCEMSFIQTGVDASLVEKNWRTMFQRVCSCAYKLPAMKQRKLSEEAGPLPRACRSAFRQELSCDN
jgi:hypothetical protein